ncbi:Prenyltransferase and squalene oxidase repeat [Carpediemonas membranifera]|uniref:Prenyltransferase and squalene oxidase repeat n=1 Tax=Carpediemonas membranifera TaxID=201153 RepID=A0A8J6B0V8_9EUKA|nr:Prenyltransferase and squalene oxidase repeat [Carpediemonas membranifera]|eukprot:KAG9393198.1 Prenyltransferase and squalene oxidase repeat [Carpediemonas membranifera]
MSEDDVYLQFDLKGHAEFVKYVLIKGMPGNQPANLIIDEQQLSIVYFLVGTLKLLSSWDSNGPLQKNLEDFLRLSYIEADHAGSTVAGWSLSPKHKGISAINVTATFQAVSLARMTGADFSYVDMSALAAFLRLVQRPDGAVAASHPDGEADLRFVYSAVAVDTMLHLKALASPVAFISACQTFEGSFAQCPGLEGHAGSTFCAIAALRLLKQDIPRRSRVVEWLALRQVTGFQGRPNKLADACYTFWVGSSLKMLDSLTVVHRPFLLDFVKRCENILPADVMVKWQPDLSLAPWTECVYAGFSKHPDKYPDPLHTYLALCGLSLLGVGGLPAVEPELAMMKQ